MSGWKWCLASIVPSCPTMTGTVRLGYDFFPVSTPADVATPSRLGYHPRDSSLMGSAMPRVVSPRTFSSTFTVRPASSQGGLCRECLDGVFAQCPDVRGYILDDQGSLRKHVVIYIGESTIVDRIGLSDAVDAAGEIFVFQALSGG